MSVNGGDMGQPITTIHQIEITSRCNLTCTYCPSPKLQRSKIDMSVDIYGESMKWVEFYRKKGTQGELNLAGIGESTMHPRFVQYVEMARKSIGPILPIVIATNGLLITDEMAKELKPFNLQFWVSLHRPEKAGPAVEILKRWGLLIGVSADPSVAAIDWAGQLDWHVSADRSPCPWLRRGWGMVLSDGRITTCCLDASGVGVVGNIFDDVSQIKLNRYTLCQDCHQDP